MGKNSIFIKCEEANHVCDKNQYKEASFSEKIKLVVHVIYCAACRKYSMSNTKLTKLVKKSEVDAIEDSEKYKMKALFDKELSKFEKELQS